MLSSLYLTFSIFQVFRVGILSVKQTAAELLKNSTAVCPWTLPIQFLKMIIVFLGLIADWITKTGNMEVNLFILEGLAQQPIVQDSALSTRDLALNFHLLNHEIPDWILCKINSQGTIYIYQDSKLFLCIFNWFKRFYGQFGQSNVHRTFDSGPSTARIQMYHSLMPYPCSG